MESIRNKLRDTCGASMLMALLLMLVAVMVSAVIVASALSAAISVRNDREQQQVYLTVSSAASLMRDALEAGQCDMTTTQVTTTTTTLTQEWAYKWVSTDYYWPYNRNYEWTKNGAAQESDSSEETQSPTTKFTKGDSPDFGEILKAGIESLGTDTSKTYERTYTITVAPSAAGIAGGSGSGAGSGGSGSANDSDFVYDTVTAEVLMQYVEDSLGADRDVAGSYALTVTFTGGSGENACRITLTATCRVTSKTVGPVDDEENSKDPKKPTSTPRWTGQTDTTHGTKVTRTTATTTYTWENVILNRPGNTTG